ncbi:MAG: DUF1697 domain-containing protein [Halobacteriota archaeon]
MLIKQDSATLAAELISRAVKKRGRQAMKCVALLRGINVSGRKTVNMTDLQTAFLGLGFDNVRTYGQSGNVIFDCGRAATVKLTTRVEEKLRKSLGFSINVIVRTHQELERIIDNNPLVGRAGVAQDKLHVTFLLDTPDASVASKLDIKPDGDEKFVVFGKEVISIARTGTPGQN